MVSMTAHATLNICYDFPVRISHFRRKFQISRPPVEWNYKIWLWQQMRVFADLIIIKTRVLFVHNILLTRSSEIDDYY